MSQNSGLFPDDFESDLSYLFQCFPYNKALSFYTNCKASFKIIFFPFSKVSGREIAY